MNQSSLFESAPESHDTNNIVQISLADKVRRSVNNLKRLIRDGFVCTVASSFGKDSSVCVSLVLMAYRELVSEGFFPPTLHIMNSNTGIENPVVDQYVDGEIKKLEVLAQSNELPIKIWRATPSLSNNYLVNIIGGRMLFSFPDNDRKCQQMMKANPLRKTKRKILDFIRTEIPSIQYEKVLTLIGTRFDESDERARKMKLRNESDMFPTFVSSSDGGNWTLSPIANFTTWDIFEYIGLVTSGKIETYSNFQALVDIYRDSEGGECMVNIYISGTGSPKTSCGSRHGCHQCFAVSKDRSMDNMLNDQDERFLWMKGLSSLRQFVQATHYDLSRRNWLARTVNEDTGGIKISPNAYSPEYCLDLLRYILTIDVREEEASAELGLPEPRFKCLQMKDILAIDCLWNRYGYQQGLKASETFKAIYLGGERYEIPDGLPIVQPQPMPRDQEVPFADEHYWDSHNGLRDLGMATGGQEAVIEKGGRLYSDVNTADEFEVDEEGAALFFGFELDYALNKYSKPDSLINPTAALEYLLRLGVVSIYKGSHSEWDRMLRLANQIWRHGIRDCLNDPVELVRRLSHGKSTYVNFQEDLFNVR